MSWSYGFEGSPDKVKEDVIKQAVLSAKNYVGTPEADDIITVKNRIISLIDLMVLDEELPNVKVNAYGSHSNGNAGLVGANATFSVNRCK